MVSGFLSRNNSLPHFALLHAGYFNNLDDIMQSYWIVLIAGGEKTYRLRYGRPTLWTIFSRYSLERIDAISLQEQTMMSVFATFCFDRPMSSPSSTGEGFFHLDQQQRLSAPATFTSATN
jgi:hypothetical protein